MNIKGLLMKKRMGTDASRVTRVLMMAVLLVAGIVTFAEAAIVSRIGNYTTAATLNNQMNYTVPAGSNRVMIVAWGAENTTGTISVSSVTYGGQPVTLIRGQGDGGTGFNNYTWFGYCNEACIASAVGTTIQVNSTGTLNVGTIGAATYANVEQATPIYASNSATSGASPISTSVNTIANARVIFGVNFNGQTNSLNAIAGWTEGFDVPSDTLGGGNSHSFAVAERDATTAATPVNITATAAAASSRTNIVAFALQESLCTPTNGPVTITGGNVNGNPISVCGTYTTNGATLSNVSINQGGPVLYSGASCSGISTAGWADGSTNITVQATDSCGSTISNSGTFNFSSCVPTAGPFDVIDGSILSGATTDVTTALNVDPLFNVSNIKVYEVTGAGVDIDQLSSFNAGGLSGWGANWKATGPDGATLQTDPPGNGDLQTGTFTRSAGTGPSTTPTGEFVFYEASTGAATDRFLVHNTTFDSANNHLEVEFKYNMNGANIGTLALQAQNPNYNGGAWTTEWTRSGNQNDVWQNAAVNLYAGGGLSGASYISGNTKLRFRFAYGGGPAGDIALDEVRILGPRGTGALLFNGTRLASQTANTAGWPEGTIKIELTGTDDCGGALSAYGFGSFVSDTTLPIVTSFNLPLTSLSPIPVYSFTGTDNLILAAYLITTSSTKPLATNPGWTATKPLKITTAATGPVTYYAWVKDGAGNVSNYVAGTTNQTVTIQPDVTAPVITQFTLPASSFSPISVLTFSVSDDSGTVTGYMINTSATPPLAGDAGWLPDPPTKITTGATGSTNFYAWAKDSAGNISGSVLQTVNVLVDVNPPTVSFLLPATHNALTVPITTFAASDLTGGAAVNTGVAAYMVTTTATQPAAGAAGWKGTPPTTVTVAGEGASTFWGWAKDNSGNVSAGISQTVTVTLPVSCEFNMNPAGTLIQTENWAAMGAPNPWAWDTILTPLADTNGAQSTYPDTSYRSGGNDISVGGYIITAAGGTGSQTQGSRADYPVFFPNGTEGNWCIWIRGLDQSGAGGGDSNFWGVDGAYVGAMTQAVDNGWAWTNGTQNGARCTNITVNGQDEYPPSSGTFGQWHTLNLWPREQGQKNDMIYFIRNTSATALGAFTGNNDQTTVLPRVAHSVIDPTCVDQTGGGPPGGGGGSGYINIPDGQSVSGSPINTELLFNSDLSKPLQYRALGAPTDGYEHQTVDPKWFHSNIGNDPLLVDTVPMVEGQSIFKLAGSGSDIWNTSDFFAYHYQPGITGNFTIDVNMKKLVDKQTNTNTNQNASAKAGIMVRQSLSTNSRNVMMLVTATNGSRLQRRVTDGGTTAYVNGTNNGVAAGDNTWLRLRRTGNLFEGFHSTNNGQTWTSVGTTTVSMTGAVNIGLGVTSHNTARDSIGSFDNFLFMPAGMSGMSETWGSTATGLNTTLPTAWVSGTYGLAVRDTGTGVYAANTFDYDPCTDLTPSSISVHSGAVVGGSAVSLANLFDHTGNVGGYTYEINGNSVNNPWNSFSLVPTGTSANVTLKVTGTDPDCGGTVYTNSASITVNNTCTDPTPSTITILTGQVVGGPSVDLTKLYSSTGNVAAGGLTYKINDMVMGDPTKGDSRQFGTAAADAVSLEISGIDPDCGNGVTAVNNLLVDNGCTRNFPSISFDRDVNYVGKGRAVPYQVTIRNEDSFNCGPSSFNVNVLSDSNGSDFDPSYFNPTNSNLGLVLQGRQTATFELAVKATATAVEWQQNVTTLEITSSYATHNTPKTTKAVTTKVFLVSPITHNSVTTGSTKWGGNWGTSDAGSKYGNFDCLTCHSKTGSEIKWMRGTIATPDGSNWGTSGQPSLPMLFKDARSVDEVVAEGGNPINDVYWGHDDPLGNGSGRTSSNRACEVCHSVTQHHRYNTNVDPDGGGPLGPQTIVADETHFPGRDCTDCHRHSLGFTADCTGCHGDPPLDATIGGPNGLADIPARTGSVTPGTHYKHTVVLGYDCEYCHAGWRDVGEMPKEVFSVRLNKLVQQINHRFNVFFDLGMTDPVANNGHYSGQDYVNYEPHAAQIALGEQDADGTIPPGKGTMTCDSIYCHGGTESMGGTNPQWNGNIACNSCHGTSPTNTPPGYSHTTHVGKMKLECTVCHFTGGQNAGYNGHVNGRVNLEMNTPAWQALTPMYDPDGSANFDGGANLPAAVAWNSNPGGNDMPPSAQYGTCLNVACHYGNETPVWNNNGNPATCTTCHNDGNNDGTLVSSAPSSGYHKEHVKPTAGTIHETMISSFVNKCESCHGGGSNTAQHPGHVNFNVDLGGGMTFSDVSQTCTSQCHSLEGIDTKGTVPTADDTEVAITWLHNANYVLACEACHAAPYLGPTIVDPDAEGVGINVPIGGDNYGSHLKGAKTDTFSSTTNWSAQCRKCHPYHAAEAGLTTFTIPQPSPTWDQLGDGTDMAEKLGLQFPVTGGIHMGGTATGGRATEAEMCWFCHDAVTTASYTFSGVNVTFGAPATITATGIGNKFPVGRWITITGSSNAANNRTFKVATSAANAIQVTIPAGEANLASVGSAAGVVIVSPVSEWQVNDSSATGSLAYNYGTVSTSNWTTAVWTSGVAQFGYKSATIRSTHAASTANGAVSGNDPLAAIRCTYCHDVHDRNKALKDHVAGTYETLTGKPYLRGGWTGNPYKEDGAPQAGTVYTNFGTDRFGQVPRGSIEQTQLMGGFWIDQNSGDPVAGKTYNDFGQLCQMCHGTNVNTLNQYGAQGAGWVSGYNGHANSVIGGSGAGTGAEATARNIFNGRGGGTNGYNGYMGYWGYREPGDGGGGLRGGDGDSRTITPGVDGYGNEPCANDNGACDGNYANGHHWEDLRPLNMTGTTTDSNYHTFSCAKCHNPHASRLPKLMITNCLDTKHNQWDNNIQHTITTPAVLNNVTAAAWSTAQNCHRLVANDPFDTNDQNQNAQGAGWNRVTPWSDGDANYGTTGDKTQDNSGTW